MKIQILAAAACLLAAGQASALIASSVGAIGGADPGIRASESMVVTFDAPNAPGILETNSGSVALFTGTILNVAAAPVGDATKYQAISTGGSVTFDFGHYSPVQTLSVYLGSIDAFNTFQIKTNLGTSYFNGNAFLVHGGNQTSSATNRRVYFEFAYGETLQSLTLGSNGIAFEYDNIAVGPAANVPPSPLPSAGVPLVPYRYTPSDAVFAPLAAPEPQSWALMILGTGLVGGCVRRRRFNIDAGRSATAG